MFLTTLLMAATARPPVAPPAKSPAAVPVIPQPTIAPVQSSIAQHLPWLTHFVAGVFVVAAIALIALLAVQTTKQEGLTGSIGGRVESTYRGRLGTEEVLKRWTGGVAVVFVVAAFVLSITGI